MWSTCSAVASDFITTITVTRPPLCGMCPRDLPRTGQSSNLEKIEPPE
jgi:hypothetical protein